MSGEWPAYRAAKAEWKHGFTQFSLRNETVEERLLRRSVRNVTTGCLAWQGGLWQGYGKISMPRSANSPHRYRAAHRVAYETWVGPIPEGLTIDHLCRNRACIEPSHLEAVPTRVNTLRGAGPSAINAEKGYCKRGHELAPPNLIPNKTGRRICRLCQRAHERASFARRRRENYANGLRCDGQPLKQAPRARPAFDAENEGRAR